MESTKRITFRQRRTVQKIVSQRIPCKYIGVERGSVEGNETALVIPDLARYDLSIATKTLTMKRFSTCKVIDGIAQSLIKNGWVIKSKNRHLRLFNPCTRQTITVPGSPSDPRATENWLHQIRRSGVQLC